MNKKKILMLFSIILLLVIICFFSLNIYINKQEEKKYYIIDKKAFNYGNTKSKQQMADKSFAMLQDRYNNGLISLEEFTRKCNNLEKQRRN